MPDNVLIDGDAADASALNDRACQFGDGLFETVAIIDGSPCLWRAHMQRLAEGCRRLRLTPPDAGALAEECRRLCAGRGKAVLKIFWTAGTSKRGYRRPNPPRPRRVLQVFDWPDMGRTTASTLRLCKHRLSENPATAQIKHLNRLDQVIARAEWDDAGIGEGLMLGQDGRVVCGTMSNLFTQHGDLLATPATAAAGVAGVVRGLVLSLADEADQPVRVGDLSIDDVRGADALYLTNCLLGVVRVEALEAGVYDRAIREHPLLTQARRLCLRPDTQGQWHE